VLPNGIVILSRANFNSPSVVINAYLQAGGLFDPDEKLGLADFTALALMRGSQSFQFQEIFDRLESVGASLGFNSGTHTAGFGGRALAEDLDLLLDLVSEILIRPVFPDEQVERLRAQLLAGLAIRDQDTGDLASLALDGILYAGHPYSRPDDGYSETVAAITRDDLEAFHQRCYGPRDMVIVVVGAVDPAEAVDRVGKALGGWRNPAQQHAPELPPVRPLEEIVRRRVTVAGKSQADLMMGTPGPPRRSPDYLAAALGNSVLGQFGMMGRIGDVVREQEGLAYYATSSLGGGIGPGPWSVSAGVDPDNVEKTIDLILKEIARFVGEPVAPEELADCQANFIGSLPLSLESNGGVASRLLSLERYSLGLDYYRRYPDLVRSVTVEEVLETARNYLDPARLGIAIAGPG
jgi:zinc protease